MDWNHRVVKMMDEGEPFFCIREVYYNDSGEPIGHGDPFMHANSMDGLETLVRRLGVSLSRPVLDDDTDFDNPPNA